MPIAIINGIHCYYEVHGKGKPLMLIGGLASDSQTWQLVLPHLKEHFQTVIFDNRGVGRTQCPNGPFDIAELAKDAVGLLEFLGIEKADILGHSMGGYIAQEIAITYPRKVNGLILASTAAFTSERNKLLFADMLTMLTKNFAYEVFLKTFMYWILTPSYFRDRIKTDAFLNFMLEYPYRQTTDGFRRQVQACAGFDAYDRLDKMNSKVLLLAGEQDILIPRPDTELLAKRIPQAKVEFIEGAAHSLFIESPEACVKAIEAFCT